MKKDSKIYIAGHNGMVGSAIRRNLENQGYSNLVFSDRIIVDLTDQGKVSEFFSVEKPEYVFLAAAKVGGIAANNRYRAQFIYENLTIQNNIIHQSYLHGVKKLLFLGSSCIYPKNCPQPIKEEYLLTDELEYTNEPYAIAKIAGIKMCESYNIQYGTDFISVMPTNLYGPNDNYDLEKSHVLPALIRKMHLGKCLHNNDWNAIRKDVNKYPVEGANGSSSETEIIKALTRYGIMANYSGNVITGVKVVLWGSGMPYREFMHVGDLAEACVFLMNNVDACTLAAGKKEISNTHLNIGTGKDITIKDLAWMIKGITEFTGEILWDKSKPDGTYRKLLDTSKINKLGWSGRIQLEDGIRLVYDEYCI